MIMIGPSRAKLGDFDEDCGRKLWNWVVGRGSKYKVVARARKGPLRH